MRWWNWHFVFLLAGSTVVNHVLALAIHRARRQRARQGLLALAVGLDIGSARATSSTPASSSAPTDNVLGTDVDRERDAPGRDLLLHVHGDLVRRRHLSRELVPASLARFAVFQAFFPHLVAGPIVRASELLPQLEAAA